MKQILAISALAVALVVFAISAITAQNRRMICDTHIS